jgi:hypothetical protein
MHRRLLSMRMFIDAGSQKLKTIQMSTTREWINKPCIYIHTMECDLALERNKVPLHITYTEGKKLASKENVLNDSVYMRFYTSKSSNCG